MQLQPRLDRKTKPRLQSVLGIRFSFGSLICMQLIMRRPEVNNFIAVSPQPNVYDFSFLAPCPTSGQVIFSENDELVTQESIEELDNRIKVKKV